MPFKSKAHMEKFMELVKEGKISQKEYEKMHKETKNPHLLPKRVPQEK